MPWSRAFPPKRGGPLPVPTCNESLLQAKTLLHSMSYCYPVVTRPQPFSQQLTDYRRPFLQRHAVPRLTISPAPAL